MIRVRFVRRALMAMLFVSLIQALGQENTAGQATTAPPPSGNTSASRTSSKGRLFSGTVEPESGIQTKGAEAGIATSENQQAKQKSEFAVAPLPLLNPFIGNGMGGTVLYLAPLDSNRTTPASIFGVAGFGTGTVAGF